MSQSGDFRELLLDIDAHLDSKDLELLKFLCRDVVPFSVLEKCKRSLDIFTNLEQRGKLKEGKSIYLQECFHYMKRKDLIRKLGGDPQKLEDRIRYEGPAHLFPFRVLLFEIAEDCGKEELEKMKFYSKTTLHLPKKMTEKVKNCLDLFSALEKEELITNIQVRTLEQLITITEDEELMDYLYEYKNKNLVSSPTDEMNAPLEIKQDLGINHCQDTPAVATQGQQQPAMNLPFQSERTSSPRISYSSLNSMTPPAQDAGESLLSRQQFPQTPQVTPEPSDDFINFYKMTSKPRGYCLIINNQKFHGEIKFVERKGTDIDEEKLKNVFGKHLHFKMDVTKDATSQQIKNICRDFSKKDHSQFDCIAVCVLSHGTTGAVYGSDCKKVNIQEITSCFTASRCPTLANKPKLFFFQACQGLTHQSGLQRNGGSTRVVNGGIQTDITPEPPREEGEEVIDDVATPQSMIPDESDFLLGYATVPGYVSYRSRSAGSFYISILAEKLEKHALGSRSQDLMSILTEVNNAVSELHYRDPQGVMYKQVPAPQFTLRRKLQFDKC
uniref:Caspase-8 n=1 Tax=Crassostrea virginica TaxID=6565 RepID=A0A8B8DAK2_CRAVI|nr:caspase-8-like [Crassostrea virginica]